MHEQSQLQIELIKRIDNFYGVDELIKFLESYTKTLHGTEKISFFNLIHYYEALYLYYVPVENDVIEYIDAAIETIQLLQKLNSRENNKYLFFLIGLIGYSLKYNEKNKKTKINF